MLDDLLVSGKFRSFGTGVTGLKLEVGVLGRVGGKSD